MSIGVDSVGEATIGHPVEVAASEPVTTTLLQMLNHLRFNGSSFALILVIFL